eukprot:scaffold1146_cov399-Prasinococcus_capsulatus_cf.AAC.63
MSKRTVQQDCGYKATNEATRVLALRSIEHGARSPRILQKSTTMCRLSIVQEHPVLKEQVLAGRIRTCGRTCRCKESKSGEGDKARGHLA